MKALKPEVSKKYMLVGIRPGKYSFKGFGEIDLSQLTVSRADDLFKKGFPYLKLREGATAPQAGQGKLPKPFPIGGKPSIPKTDNVEELRRNKKHVNALLSMEWAELTDTQRLLFFNNSEYFGKKKQQLFRVSEVDREMQSLHAKLKLLAEDPEKEQERGEIMTELSKLEEEKLELFGKIDTWEIKESEVFPDAIAKKAAEEALKKQKLIAAHENYIYRNEPSLANMPETTATEKKKKEKLASEIEKRKKELIDLGKPYNRKSR